MEAIKTAGILIIKDGKILLVKHGLKSDHMEDMYGIPGGKVEGGETTIDCAIRELKEETGLETKREYLKQLPQAYKAQIPRKGGLKDFEMVVFLCNKYEGELQTTEETAPEWASLENIEKLDLLPNVQQVIKDGLKLA